jgi:hypothetical protein
MEQQISLKAAERKVFKSTFQDGLWDIFIGCLILQFAIAPLLSSRLGDFWSSVVFLPFWVLVFTVIWLVRKSVVTPRLGMVKFGAARKTQLTKFTTIMLVINLIAFMLGMFSFIYFDITSGYLYPVTFGFIVLMLSSVAAYFLECTRFFIYGCLFVLALIIGEILFTYFRVAHHGFPITFGFTAVIIIATGIVLFLRLLRQYPLPTMEPDSESKDDDK